jgi:hypothetical protein
VISTEYFDHIPPIHSFSDFPSAADSLPSAATSSTLPKSPIDFDFTGDTHDTSLETEEWIKIKMGDKWWSLSQHDKANLLKRCTFLPDFYINWTIEGINKQGILDFPMQLPLSFDHESEKVPPLRTVHPTLNLSCWQILRDGPANYGGHWILVCGSRDPSSQRITVQYFDSLHRWDNSSFERQNPTMITKIRKLFGPDIMPSDFLFPAVQKQVESECGFIVITWLHQIASLKLPPTSFILKSLQLRSAFVSCLQDNTLVYLSQSINLKKPEAPRHQAGSVGTSAQPEAQCDQQQQRELEARQLYDQLQQQHQQRSSDRQQQHQQQRQPQSHTQSPPASAQTHGQRRRDTIKVTCVGDLTRAVHLCDDPDSDDDDEHRRDSGTQQYQVEQQRREWEAKQRELEQQQQRRSSSQQHQEQQQHQQHAHIHTHTHTHANEQTHDDEHRRDSGAQQYQVE